MANCIKCGKELVGTKVFCDDCLKVMNEHPVPSGTPLIIHQRQTNTGKKAPAKKKAIPPEEQVQRLRKVIRWLIALVLVLFVLLSVAACWLTIEIQEPDWIPEETKGQGYGTAPPGK